MHLDPWAGVATPAHNVKEDHGGSLADPEPETVPQLPRIRLFLDNLWEHAGRDRETFRDEVRVTLLHELGHYLGLDEDQVAELGLA